MRMFLWLRALFFRARVETEMEKELRLHLEMETENNIRLGLSPAAAKRAALVAFGGVEQTKEAVRDERRTRWLEELATDLRFALRGFRMNPLFATGVITLIALGVGVNAAIFSVINHTLLAPLPYADGNRMVELSATAGGGTILAGATQADADRWRARARAVEQIIVMQRTAYQLGDSTRGPTETLSGVRIPPGALAFTDARPFIGRDIAPADTLRDAAPVALLGYDVWMRVYGANPSILGQTILLDGTRHQVIGVLPRDFAIPFVDGRQVFTNLRRGPGNRDIDAIAKLRRGSTVDDANCELVAIFNKLDASVAQDAPKVMRAVDDVEPRERRLLFTMFGAVFIVLAIACANVANLMMTRAWSRQREFAIRAAMGAGRMRLVRQMFTESLALSLAGGAAGIGVALLTHRLLIIARPPYVGDFTNARIDPMMLWWSVALCVITGVLFGLAPALFVARHRTGESLKAGARSAAGSRGSRRFRSGLVIAEVALSAVLLVASGLLVRTMVAMHNADIGLNPRGLWGVRIGLGDKQLGDSIARKAAVDGVLQRVRAVPGIQSATLAMSLPPAFATGMGQVEIEGIPVAPSDSLKSVSFTSVRPDYFSVTGGRITRGRIFAPDPAPTDIHRGGELVVNETFARRFFPDGNVLGARLRRGAGPWSTIVGVAADVNVPAGLRGTVDRTQFYDAMPGSPSRGTLIVRSIAPMSQMLPSVAAAIKAANPRIRIGEARTSELIVAGARELHRFTLVLIGAFAGLALVLAAFGLHAVIAYTVGQRTREIGVRIALGAQSHDVIGLVLGQGIKLSVVGVVAGAIGGVATAAVMRAMLYGVTPADPLTLVAVSVLLGGVALVASYAPARRAVNVDPVDALRSE